MFLAELRNLHGTSNHVFYLIHGVRFSDCVNHIRVQVLSILELLLAYSQDWTGKPPDDYLLEDLKTNEFDKKHSKKAGAHISRNVVNIIKMKTIARKPWTMKIIKLRFRNSDNQNL